jgi:hypothetical protein
MKLSSIKETTMTRVSNKEDIDSTTIKETNDMCFIKICQCYVLHLKTSMAYVLIVNVNKTYYK